MEQPEIKINHIETKSVMTKSNTPIGGYSVNPYVGCPHACKYCYASFMKRFTGHTEEWGTFMDVKDWPEIKNPKKYAGQKVIIGTVTDGYNPLEEAYNNTRRLLEELKDSGADILICTKSDLVLRDLDLRGGFKADIMKYISDKHPDLVPLYDEIYNKKNRSYFEALEKKAEELAKKYDCRFVDNETPYERVEKGHPTIVDYFYHEEVRGTANSGKRNVIHNP